MNGVCLSTDTWKKSKARRHYTAWILSRTGQSPCMPQPQSRTPGSALFSLPASMFGDLRVSSPNWHSSLRTLLGPVLHYPTTLVPLVSRLYTTVKSHHTLATGFLWWDAKETGGLSPSSKSSTIIPTRSFFLHVQRFSEYSRKFSLSWFPSVPYVVCHLHC